MIDPDSYWFSSHGGLINTRRTESVCGCDGAAVLQIEKALTDTFVPAVREAAIVQCINEGLTVVQQALAAVGGTEGDSP